MDGLIGVMILAFFLLAMALPFILCLALAILVSDWIAEKSAVERRRFMIRVIIWTPSLTVVVPSYYARLSAVYTFSEYWIWFYSTPHMIAMLSLGWLVGVVIMLVLQYRRALFGLPHNGSPNE